MVGPTTARPTTASGGLWRKHSKSAPAARLGSAAARGPAPAAVGTPPYDAPRARFGAGSSSPLDGPTSGGCGAAGLALERRPEQRHGHQGMK